MTVMLLAFAASLCFAAAYVLQYHEAHEAPRGLFLSPKLLVELAHHRIWVGGIAAMMVGNVLQAAAIGSGSLAVVEPVLTASLLFALPISAAWRRERLRRTEWAGAILVSAGLGLVLGVGSPTAGASDMAAYKWLLVTLTAWGLGLGLVATGLRTPWPSYRAALIGGAAGTLFGLQDALTRYCLHWMSRDFAHLALSWQPYVLLITAVYGLVLAQSAYEAGSLSASLPPMAVGEPIIGILIGMLALDERLDTSALALSWECIGAIGIVWGSWLLARSPLVCGTGHKSRLPHLRPVLMGAHERLSGDESEVHEAQQPR
jgi:drug/metabolite transporter (DMT)-like permease